MTAQVVAPRIRGFISLTAHPEGCAARVRHEAAVAAAALAPLRVADAAAPGGERAPRVLVVGASTGYGLASLLAARFGWRADTLGVCLERPSEEERGGSAGWYNLAAAHALAGEGGDGPALRTVNADAYRPETKAAVVAALRESVGPVDLVVYSLAAPRRTGPHGETWQSALKPIDQRYTGKTIDLRNDAVVVADIEPASADEIEATVRVMGGDDWADWIDALAAAELLAPGCRTVAYSYIGPPVTHAIYHHGTIGRAKAHLAGTARALDARLRPGGGGAWVSMNKAVVTQASAAIPGVTLYMSLLFREMRQRGTHEGPIEQIVRLYRDHLAPGRAPDVDGEGYIRLDDLEMAPDVQAAVAAAWEHVDTASLHALADYDRYGAYFRELFGFDWPGIDYDAPTEIHRPIPGVVLGSA